MKHNSCAMEYENCSVQVDGKQILQDVNLKVSQGTMLAIIGLSGAGKSTLFKATLGISPYLKVSGHIWISVPVSKQSALSAVPRACLQSIGDGSRVDINKLTSAARRRLLGTVVSAVPQLQPFPLDPLRSPVRTIVDAVRAHDSEVAHAEALDRAETALKWAGLPANRWNMRAGELSGGQVQRVLIALARVNNPTTYLFDEPTSALDPRAKTELLDLMDALTQSGAAVVVVTHDLSTARHADEIVVLDQGRIVEQGTTEQVLICPSHPLSQKLVAAELSCS